MRLALTALLVLGQSQTVYEYEAPKGYPRFTTDRAAIPRGVPWRVFKQGAADGGTDAGVSSPAPRGR